MFIGKGLELAVMCCHDRKDMGLIKMLNHGHGKGCSFCRIGPDTDFIDKDQIAIRGFPYNGNHVLHMTGKSGQALFNALFIANIGVNPGKHRKNCFFSRKKEPRLGHEGKKADGL